MSKVMSSLSRCGGALRLKLCSSAAGRGTGKAAASTASSGHIAKQKDGKEKALEVPPPRRSSLSSALRAGTGGRSSFSGNVCTVFGCTGFMGWQIVNEIAKDGTQLVLPYRCDPYWVREMKISGDLGQILFFPFELRDEDSIRKAVKYSNVVVNLVGTHFSTGKFSYEDVNVTGAARLARIAKEMGVSRFVHLSALNADKNPEPRLIPGGSQFLRSKALGEEAVRNEFPEATIIRPADIFGFADRFVRVYFNRLRQTFFFGCGLYKGGQETFKTPVYKDDVATGVARIVADPSFDGRTYEFVGPHTYKLGDMVDQILWFHNNTNAYRLSGYPIWVQFMTNFFEIYYGIRKQAAPWDWEYIDRTEYRSDKLSGCETLEDVIPNQPLHKFEYLMREAVMNRTYGVHKEKKLYKLHNEIPGIKHHPHLYRDDAPQRRAQLDLEEKRRQTFESFTRNIASPFAAAT